MSALAFEVFRIPLVIKRKIASTYVNGIWVPESSSNIVITASVQPTTGEELLTLPEARRDRKTYTCFTSSQIFLVRGAVNTDQVTIFAEVYDVIRVEVWQNNPPVFGIVNHYKFYASAVEAIA